MPTRVTSWINEVNTTSLRIIASVVGAVVNITAIQIALLLGWQPTEIAVKVMLGEAGVLLTMMGYDVIQFISKRFSHTDYVAAKNPSPVTVEPPATVVVTPGSDTPAVAVTPREPEKGE